MFDTEKPDVDELIHYGKKGMRWGVRQQYRLDRANAVAKGTASRATKARFAITETSGLSIARGGGVKGAAASKAKQLGARKERIERGDATVKDLLANYGGDRLLYLK
jgi:hypothetical protein